MKPQKVEKLKRDVAGFLTTIRTAAVRLEGRTKVAVQVDAKVQREKDVIGRLTKFAAGILESVETVEKAMVDFDVALADPTPEPAPKADAAKKS